MDKPSSISEIVEDEEEADEVAEEKVAPPSPSSQDFEPGLTGKLDRELLM